MTTVVDLGCGTSYILQHVEGKFHSIGVDAFVPYLEISKKKGIHSEYICENIFTVTFPPKSVDCTIMFEVIEHVFKNEGYELIKKMEAWSKKKIIITTPNGFHLQGAYDDNDFQEHK